MITRNQDHQQQHPLALTSSSNYVIDDDTKSILDEIVIIVDEVDNDNQRPVNPIIPLLVIIAQNLNHSIHRERNQIRSISVGRHKFFQVMTSINFCRV